MSIHLFVDLVAQVGTVQRRGSEFKNQRKRRIVHYILKFDSISSADPLEHADNRFFAAFTDDIKHLERLENRKKYVVTVETSSRGNRKCQAPLSWVFSDFLGPAFAPNVSSYKTPGITNSVGPTGLAHSVGPYSRKIGSLFVLSFPIRRRTGCVGGHSLKHFLDLCLDLCLDLFVRLVHPIPSVVRCLTVYRKSEIV